LSRNRTDEYFGTLVNAYLAQGGEAAAVKAGEAYVDLGTLHGYRAAMSLLQEIQNRSPQASGLPPTALRNRPGSWATLQDGVGRQ
jgi:glucose-1-phosphate thymidylyltransferase